MSSANEPVQIVDARNRPVATAPRGRMRRERLHHRATFIFVVASDSRLFVQRRTMTKDLYPGWWDLAAGGVVGAGEDWSAAAARELFEELGIENTPLVPGFEFYYEDERNRCFGRTWHCVHDGPFRLQAEEVASGHFLAIDAVTAGALAPVTPDTLFAFDRWRADSGGRFPFTHAGYETPRPQSE